LFENFRIIKCMLHIAGNLETDIESLRLEIFTAVLLQLQVFLDVMLYCWTVECLTMKKKAL